MKDDQSRSSASVSHREMRSAEGFGSIESENQSRTSTSMDLLYLIFPDIVLDEFVNSLLI